MAELEDRLGRGAAVLGLGWRVWLRYRAWRAARARATFECALARLNRTNGKAIVRIEAALRRAEERRRRFDERHGPK